MLKPEFTEQFKKDYKAAVKRGCNIKELTEAIYLLYKEYAKNNRFPRSTKIIFW